VRVNNNWVYITQLEAYVRNNTQIDDWAISTRSIPNYDSPRFRVERKTEFRNEWLEISFFWRNVELLVTGGLHGTMDSEIIYGFLGPSFPPTTFSRDDSWSIYIKKDTAATVSEPRELRNFSKRASCYEGCSYYYATQHANRCSASDSCSG
jgi:hypothetical protein